MLQMPEFEGPGGASSGVRPTLPMADGRASPRVQPEVARTPLARRVAWITLGLVACAGLALLFVGVSGGPLAFWGSESSPEEPPPISFVPSPEGQGATEPVTTPPSEEPEPAASAPPEPQRPAPRSPTPKPSTPTPPPKTAPTPTPPVPTPPLPVPPSPTTPSPAPPASPLPSPPLPLPQLPWTLPTAGACERCLQALRGSGPYSVVTAATEALLCEDRAARANCEREIGGAAPEVAERAAREGNCPAALATVAAAVNLGVAPDRFAAVNALCLR